MKLYVPFVKQQVEEFCPGAKAAVILDCARAHISPSICKQFIDPGMCPIKIPGGCTSWLQFIDTDAAFVFRSHQQRLYFQVSPQATKRSSKMKRHLLVWLVAKAWGTTATTLNIFAAFERLGYIDPTKTNLRVQFQYRFQNPSDAPAQDPFATGLREAERQLAQRKPKQQGNPTQPTMLDMWLKQSTKDS